MNAAAAGKLALCICTGAVIGAGVNEARHNKPGITKAAAPKGAGRKVVQFPCEPYIVQDQMLRDTEIPVDFDAATIQLASLEPGGGGNGGGGKGGGGTPGGHSGGGGQVPEPAMLGLLGLGALGLLGGRKALLSRVKL
jgi:uncharacterized membrane protein YgcG